MDEHILRGVLMGLAALGLIALFRSGWAQMRREQQARAQARPVAVCTRCGHVRLPGDVHGEDCCTVLCPDAKIRQYYHFRDMETGEQGYSRVHDYCGRGASSVWLPPPYSCPPNDDKGPCGS